MGASLQTVCDQAHSAHAGTAMRHRIECFFATTDAGLSRNTKVVSGALSFRVSDYSCRSKSGRSGFLENRMSHKREVVEPRKPKVSLAKVCVTRTVVEDCVVGGLVQGKEKLDWSGRVDLNHRPPGPEPGALARLRYAPTTRTRARKKAARMEYPE